MKRLISKSAGAGAVSIACEDKVHGSPPGSGVSLSCSELVEHKEIGNGINEAAQSCLSNLERIESTRFLCRNIM